MLDSRRLLLFFMLLLFGNFSRSTDASSKNPIKKSEVQSLFDASSDADEAFEPGDFESWMSVQYKRSLRYLFRNISPQGTAPGSVVASPQRSNPDYYYHWVRDAALTMDVVFEYSRRTKDIDARNRALSLLYKYAAFSRKNQLTPNRSGENSSDDLAGLGEPKFYMDGRAFDGDWGRPQSDGPALRALTMIKFANYLLANGQTQYVRENLYDGQLPTNSLIKADLEYVSHFWRYKTFDLWEEIVGDHFYTRMVQRKALIEGARLAENLKDFEAAKWYRGQAQALTTELSKHWDAQRGRIHETIYRLSGYQSKPSGLDAAVILGVLHGDNGDGVFSPSDERVLSTAFLIKKAFKQIYPINAREDIPGTAIGRYPEDTYDGSGTNHQGHPWFLTTLAFAEFLYRLQSDLRNQGVLKITEFNRPFFADLMPDEALEVGSTYTRNDETFVLMIRALRKEADSYMKRVAYHANRSTGEMSEQFRRDNGMMLSAENLTWSYAAFLTAVWARPATQEYLDRLRNLGIQ